MLRLIDQLPDYSKYQLARRDDDELHALRLKYQQHNGKPQRTGPQLRDWTIWHDIRADLHDLAERIEVALISVNTPKNKTPPKFKGAERPKDAAARAARKAEWEWYAEITRQVLPGWEQ